jgi:addiction module RelB/DinJ family antitoxin
MKTVLNIKVDKDQKEKAQKIAKQMGVPLSTIINAHLREFIRTQKFEISLEPRLKPEVEKELIKMSKEWHNGKREDFVVAKSAEEAIKLLNKK